MLLTERAAQKVRRRVESKVGKVINNENVVFVKGAGRGREKHEKTKTKNGAIKKQAEESQLERNEPLLWF